jgi:multiple sugar transport system permease protein
LAGPTSAPVSVARAAGRPVARPRVSGKTVFQLQLLAPAVILLVAFELYPIVLGLIIAMQRFTIYDPSRVFVGLDNFVRIATDYHFYAEVVPNTILYMVAVVAIEATLGLGLAVLLNRPWLDGRVGTIARTALLLPLMVPPVITGLMFAWMFNDQFGVVNQLIQAVGGPAVSWFTERWKALAVVILADTWMYTPYFMILLLAGLKSLPSEPHEAARIDGANAWQTFWYITLPLLFPVIVVTLIIRCFDAFRTFDLVWTITKGGPGASTEVFSVYAYKVAFTNLQYDLGSAAAMMGAFVSMLIGLAFYRLFSRITTHRIG